MQLDLSLPDTELFAYQAVEQVFEKKYSCSVLVHPFMSAYDSKYETQLRDIF